MRLILHDILIRHGAIYRGAPNIDSAYILNMAFEAFFLTIKLCNSTLNSNSGDTPRLRDVTLSFAPTHFTFVWDFRRLKTSVFGWNLCFSSTLNFWIAYFSCNDDLVSKIRDHFPNVNYLKSPNWCLRVLILFGRCRRSYYSVCTMYHYLF